MLILGSLAKVDPKSCRAAALDTFRTAETQVIVHTYVGLAIALAVIAAAVWWYRKALVERPPRTADPASVQSADASAICLRHAVHLSLRRGEVAIGSLIVNYLMQPNTLGLAAKAAGKHMQFYWGGAMVGRFIGSYLLRLFSPGKVLACVAAAVIALLMISSNTSGARVGLVAAVDRTV